MDPIILVLLGIGGVVFYVLFKKSEDNRRETLAKRLGLSVDSSMLGKGVLSGRYEGIPVRIEEFRRGNGQRSRTLTQITADITVPLPEGLKIVHESDLAQIGKIFGLQDIVIRHARLDRTAVIKAKDPDAARAFLTQAGNADALADFMERYESAKLSKGSIEIERFGPMEANAPLVLDAMADLVKVLAGEREYRGEVEPWEDAGLDADFADAGDLVKAELARRKKEGRTASTPFDREMPQPEKFGQPQPGPKNGSGSSGDGSW
ncbi:hypothetical protein FIV42_14975 [Persicimonas caeni]|uniref:Uncharacterized protein n=1 Tax=Persicimonas caeni TaxID=2292766 RepID=A0A4Y6PUH0_PERCE|nr:hypothetical protein [Persicimonas caeni]QDG51994.1 hypothetical protein FIV42_14975 [Persicimonas caeni]QED33215.1 hypothetical protein FRD00_14970 [Persicimonas caeni]